MRKIFLENRTASELRQIINNSEPMIKDSLTITKSEGGEYFLLQDTDIVKERLAVTTDEDGNQWMFIE